MAGPPKKKVKIAPAAKKAASVPAAKKAKAVPAAKKAKTATTAKKATRAPRARKNRTLQNAAPVEEETGPTTFKLQPGVVPDSESLSARQPIDPDKEPLRAAALLEDEAGQEAQRHLDDAAKWRAEVDKRRTQWLEDHAGEIYTSRLRHQFLGWVELEADPDYFTIMLKRMGIERAEVVEVHSLDDMLSDHHCLKYGIMFLSRYHDEGLEPPTEEAPSDLWFSNQIVDNACATVAILNIVNNIKTLDPGENLKSFKSFTDSFNPTMRGEALANFDWCRSIHNAFAKRTEMLTANLALQQDATKKTKKSSNKPKGKPKVEHDIPNHYIAYVPFDGNLWKLDGMDMYPRKLGPISNGEAWINTVRDDIQKRMAVFADDGTAGCTILGIVEDKLPTFIDMLGRNINHLKCTEHWLTDKRDYWNQSIVNDPEANTWDAGQEPIRGPDVRFDLTQNIIDREGVAFTATQWNDMEDCSEEHLNSIRPDIVREQLHLRELIQPLKERREAQWAKYKDRMFDYGPVINQWLKFLQENEAIGPLIEWHKTHGSQQQ